MKNPVFYGWWLVGVAFIAQMVGAGAIMYSYSVIVLPFESEFQASRMAMMLGVTVMPLVSALISPFLGRALDRYSLRAFMLVGSLALPLGFMALSFATAIWQLPVVYALFMAFASLLMGPLAASTLLARWFRTRLGLAMGIAAMGTSVGGFLFPPLVEWLIDAFEWRVAYRWLALILLSLTLPAMLLVVNRPGDRGLRAYGATDAEASGRGQTAFSTSAVLKNRNFWLVAGVISVLFATYSALLSNLVPFALDTGISKERGAMLISVLALFGMLGKIIFGVVADYVDLRAGLGVAAALIAGGLSLFLDGSFPALLGGSVCIGLAAGGMLPVWGALLARLFGADDYGRVMGMMNPVLMPMTVVAPPLAGRIYDVTGSYRIAFIVFIVALLIAICLLPAIRMRVASEAGQPS